MKNTNINNTLTLVVCAILLLTSCSYNNANTVNNTGNAITNNTLLDTSLIKEKIEQKNVKAMLVKDMHTITINAKYPAKIVPQKTVKILSKANGIITDLYVKVGDSVKENDIIGIIDKNKENSIKKTYEQANTAYLIAKTNYDNLKISIEKDLKQIEILKNQNINNKENTNIISNENYKSAKLAYETALINYEQAKLNLENKKKQLDQNEKDIIDSVNVIVNTVYDNCGTALNNINSITGFHPNNVVNHNYQIYLGALRSSTKHEAKSAYLYALDNYNNFKKSNINNINEAKNELDIVYSLLSNIRDALVKTKLMLENTVSSVELPYASNVGNSILSFLTNISNNINQINTISNQLNNIYQQVNNFNITKESQLDSLQKIYDMSKKQMEQSKQNLNNILANTKLQKDNIEYSIKSIENQYDNTFIKLQSQLEIAYLQMESAKIQMENAKIAYDNLFIRSTISGTVNEIYVSVGDNLSVNMPILSVSTTDKSKVRFYIDNEYIEYIKVNDIVYLNIENNIYTGKIISISDVADNVTYKFFVEAEISKKIKNGNIAYIQIPIKINSKNVFVKLSAITMSQNDTYIFTIKDNTAKKRSVSIIKIIGEYAEILNNIDENQYIVVDGNKNLVDGDLVKIN